ncbi:hypothetical protein KP509_13G097400 [Ceratopteris richardii]|uniref:Haloacid dehalogenase-like hydrolase domain-containing protein n=1 Tax=Ceratopteris richardii TaxID=49495 RepID=A0A8T2TNR3_CERRI|nr:hypothetical protein KP509_13G097400 [Ceratopteris richardii]
MPACAAVVPPIASVVSFDSESQNAGVFRLSYSKSMQKYRRDFLQFGTSLRSSTRELLTKRRVSLVKTSSRQSRICVEASLQALIFDCDGVILESEDLHRRAYNATFAHFNVTPPGTSQPLEWTTHFYDQLQNQIGGGKPKMRWYFKTYGWPSSTVFASAPVSDSDREALIDTLQDWKTEKYKEMIASGSVKPRPGVLELMDEAKLKGLKVAVCSAATKSSVVFCLNNLLGKDRFEGLDCFLAGDDVQKKKPDPSIYIVAAKKLAVPVEQCLVVEDSVIGLQAACGAGMKCIISYTSSTAEQDFSSACGVYADLGSMRVQHLIELMEKNVTVK